MPYTLRATSLLCVFVLGTAASYASDGSEVCVMPPSGLMAWWSADGHADDISSTNDATLVNGTTFAPGKVALAFSFDGIDDAVEAPDQPHWFFGGNDFTIDLWVMFRSLRVDNPLVSSDEGGGSTNK